ncbi:MAG: hypothetical protein RBQ87_08460 [Candidatus Cloacimonadaceae bacterium]|jgi:hypothetical protein|nr:hypothetical protein [Candidatus Cloacimonadaceae bacterium]
MMMKNDISLYHRLYELYLDSTRAQRVPSFVQEASGQESASRDEDFACPDLETEPKPQGSIRILSFWDRLISFLVVKELSDSRFLALKVSYFTEFAAEGDLILKAFGGRFVALQENSFILKKRQVLKSIPVDGVGIFDLMKAEDYIEDENYRKQGKLLHKDLPDELRYRFVNQEFDLSCELRAMNLSEDGFLKIPHLLEDNIQPRQTSVRYSLLRDASIPSHEKSISSYPEICNSMTISAKLLDDSSEISWIKGKGCEIRFSVFHIGRRCEVRLGSVLVFRGILPERLLLSISIDLADFERIKEEIEVRPLD